MIGRAVLDEDMIDANEAVAQVVMTRSSAIGRTIGDLGIQKNYRCHISRLTLSQIGMRLTSKIRLQRGDVMVLSGERQALNDVIAQIGGEERTAVQIDLETFAGGIVIGLFISQISKYKCFLARQNLPFINIDSICGTPGLSRKNAIARNI